MKIAIASPITKQHWKGIITLPCGGTITASPTKNGLTHSGLTSKVGGGNLSCLVEGLEGSRASEYSAYQGLSENIGFEDS